MTDTSEMSSHAVEQNFSAWSFVGQAGKKRFSANDGFSLYGSLQGIVNSIRQCTVQISKSARCAKEGGAGGRPFEIAIALAVAVQHSDAFTLDVGCTWYVVMVQC